MKSGYDCTTLGRSGLTVLLAGQLLPMIDFSIVNVALDAMSATLHATPIQLELIVAIYGIAFAVSLAMGSRLGDNFGRRRIFSIGVLLFGIASLLCGITPGVWTLLLARALQGVGAALVVPQILATLHVSLHGREHSRALGLYGGIGGMAFIIGQVLGGFLINANPGGYGWRSVFLINIPLCLLVLLLAPRTIPETKKQQRVPIDWAGTFYLAGAIGCLLVALALGPLFHWSWPCIALLAAFPLLLKRLWQVEKRIEQQGGAPLLPPSLMQLHGVRFGLSIAVLFFSCWSGFMFVVALTLQSGLGMSAFQSGNAFIALGVAYFIGSLLSARVVERIGKLPTLLTGCGRADRADDHLQQQLAADGHIEPGAGYWADWLGAVVYRQLLFPYWSGGSAERPRWLRQCDALHGTAGGIRPGSDGTGNGVQPGAATSRQLSACGTGCAGCRVADYAGSGGAGADVPAQDGGSGGVICPR